MRPSCPPPRIPIVEPGANRSPSAASTISVSASTSSVRDSRQARSRSRSSGRRSETIDTSRAAPRSPRLVRRWRAFRRERPCGICTIDSSESSPFEHRRGNGNAEHREESSSRRPFPGRWAAPPAAAMITSSPRDSAVDAYSNIQSGRSMRRDDLGFVRHAELGEQVDRRLHVLQIGLAAHDDADQGLADCCRLAVGMMAWSEWRYRTLRRTEERSDEIVRASAWRISIADRSLRFLRMTRGRRSRSCRPRPCRLSSPIALSSTPR